MGSRLNDSEQKPGLQPDGGFVIDDTTLDPPTEEELRAMIEKKRKQDKQNNG